MFLIQLFRDGYGTVIHEPGSSDVKVEDAKVSKERNKFDSLTFTIYPDNPGWSECEPFTATVTVTRLTDGEVVFDGRVIQRNPGMDSDGTPYREITCESVMGYLCDSLQLYVEEQHYGDSGDTTGLYTFIDRLLDRHNAAVEEHKRIYPGEITLQTFETSGGVTKSIDRASTWDNINDKILGSFGGEMRVRRSSTGRLYLDYGERLGATRATRIELARNMADSSSEVDPSAVITRLYPYGAKITETETDESGNTSEVETEERIGIESVNGGVPYIDDEDAIEAYGIIEGVQEWDDVEQPSNLLSKARSFLAENNALPVSHTFSAYDLSLLGIDPDPFEIYDWYPCRNPLIGLDETLEIVSQTIDINEPEASTFDMGETTARLSDEIGGKPWGDDLTHLESQTNTNIINAVNKVISTAASVIIGSDSITSKVQEIVNQTVTEVVSVLSDEAIAAREEADQAKADADIAKGEAATAAGVTVDNPTVLIQDQEPASAYRNGATLWIDTTGGGAVPKVWDGSAWSASTFEGAAEAAQAAKDAQAIADAAERAAETLAEEALAALNGVQQTVTNLTQTVTELVQTTDGWSFNFQTIEESITELGDQISSNYQETLKYIRFVDGEIIIGVEGNMMSLRLSNDRISFMQGGVEVAYMSSNKLYITNAEVTDTLDLGNYYFSPRQNGNLSFRYRG